MSQTFFLGMRETPVPFSITNTLVTRILTVKSVSVTFYVSSVVGLVSPGPPSSEEKVGLRTDLRSTTYLQSTVGLSIVVNKPWATCR